MNNFDAVPQYVNVSGVSLEEAAPECGYWVKAEDFEELLEAYNNVLKEKLEFSLDILKIGQPL